MGRLENKYKSEILIPRLNGIFPGSIILHNDAQLRQGIPDLLILFGPRWGILEVKRSAKAPYRPNQEWYLEKARKQGGFAATIYPENEDEVLDALQSALQPSRITRHAKR